MSDLEPTSQIDPGTADVEPAQGSLEAALTELAGRPLDDTRWARMTAGAVAWLQRVTSHGPLSVAAEIAWWTGRRDASIAGSVLAAAIAYRLFIWAIPIGFFLVVAFGTYVDAAAVDPNEALEEVGIGGYFAASIAQTSGTITGFARVVALLVATWLVLYETAILLRTARSVTALAWRIPVPRLGNPVAPTLTFLLLTAGSILAGQALTPLRAQLDGALAVVLGVVALLGLPAYWFLVSRWLLPNAARSWLDLIPGAAFFGIGMAALHLFYSLILFPWLERKEETYGVLGVAAGLLFGFFLIGRMIELSASFNAVLVERRQESA